MATLTCKVNASLLVAVTCLVLAAVVFDREYSVDALVTLLLLVPGISATLLGRMPADTLRYVALQRWSSLVLWSLLWPALSATLLATLLIEVDRTDWQRLLWLLPAFIGGPVTAVLAHIESRRAKYGFNPDTNLTGRITPNQRGDRSAAGMRSISGSYYRADVDSRVVLDVCSAGLFQADRPSRRFMVWVGLHDDQPGDFDQVVKTLEATTDARAEPVADSSGPATSHRWSSAAPQSGLTIESSTCQAAAGSGAVMAIISGERHQWRPDRGPTHSALQRHIESELKTNPHFDSDVDRKVTVVVHEIDVAPNYFFYSAPRFVDTVFSVPSDRRNTLAWLIKRIWSTDRRKFRVSYLHSPAGNAASPRFDDGERAVLKLGLAFDRDHEPMMTSSLLELHRFASEIDGCRMEAFDRRAYPEPAADEGQRPSDGYRSVAISSAGPGDANMMRTLMDRLYPTSADCDPNVDPSFSADAPFRFAGASIVTAGGYASRVLRFETREFLESTIPVRTIPVGDKRVSTWQVTNVDVPKPDRDPLTFPVWLRWQLHGENLTELLSAARRLEESTVGQDPHAKESGVAKVELNLEFLNNRVTDLGQMNGKARYRARLSFPNQTGRGAGILDDPGRAFRQALHVSLQRDLEARLTGNSTYMLVSDEEPRRPASGDDRDSEFNSY